MEAVSIIIPTLNEEDYLPLLLDSLKKIQTSIEVIVVDGNSTDNTGSVVEEYKQKFPPGTLQLIEVSDHNISLQRNIGAEQAKNDILIFCDADIIIPSPHKYNTVISEFVENNYVLATTKLKPIESRWDAQVAYQISSLSQKILLMFSGPYFGGGHLLTTKDTFQKVGGFDTNIPVGEDVDYCLRASRHGPCGFINFHVLTSARRFIKYGWGWFFKELRNIIPVLFTGKVRSEKINYPFGEFSEFNQVHGD